jgi:hypothetical protein
MSGTPTLDEFIARTWPRNAYVDYPEFVSLYIRSGDIIVSMGLEGYLWRCSKVIQIANIEAEHPGNGAFGRLVDDLVLRGLAVFVENVHNPRFGPKLLRMGFVPVNTASGPNFLYNHEGHLTLVPIKTICADRI